MVIVNVDDLVLTRWPAKLVDAGKRVRTAGSTSESASVRVAVDGANWVVSVDGTTVATGPAIVGVQPTNLACAVAAALELGVAHRGAVGPTTTRAAPSRIVRSWSPRPRASK